MGRLKLVAAVGCVPIAVSFAVAIAGSAVATAARSPHAAAASLPAGGPVPARSSATSITFVSTQTAYVLGTVPCAHRPCTEMLRTRNRGVSWVGLSAPRERVSRPDAGGLWGLRFANARHGFAFGNGFWGGPPTARRGGDGPPYRRGSWSISRSPPPARSWRWPRPASSAPPVPPAS